MPGSFVTVTCPECDTDQIVFEKVATEVACAECGATLATPSGGKAALGGERGETVEAR